METFFEAHNVIPMQHHGGRKLYSTVTAKSTIDREINRMRDTKKSVAILTTDLSAAFDTCDSFLLLQMLEHVGIRGLELQLITT